MGGEPGAIKRIADRTLDRKKLVRNYSVIPKFPSTLNAHLLSHHRFEAVRLLELLHKRALRAYDAVNGPRGPGSGPGFRKTYAHISQAE